VIQSNYDRRVRGSAEGTERLGEWLEQTATAYEYRLEARGDQRGQKKREALLAVK
jgi:hypothetical protein